MNHKTKSVLCRLSSLVMMTVILMFGCAQPSDSSRDTETGTFTIGNPTVSPASAVAGMSTEITISVEITGTSGLVADSVTLTGTTLTNAVTLTNSSSNSWGGSFTINESTEGTITFTLTAKDSMTGVTETKTFTVEVTAPTATLYFSEYSEGSSNNKYIEIYNGTGATVDLSAYIVETYINGATEPKYKLELTGTLADKATYVIGNASSSTAISGSFNTTSEVTYFNGDDAIALKSGDTVIDQIGVIGEDPGTAWEVAGTANATQDHTIIRKKSVTMGNFGSWSNSAGTTADDSEWVIFDIDSWGSIGSRYEGFSFATVSLSPEKISEGIASSLTLTATLSTLDMTPDSITADLSKLSSTLGTVTLTETSGTYTATVDVTVSTKGSYEVTFTASNSSATKTATLELAVEEAIDGTKVFSFGTDTDSDLSKWTAYSVTGDQLWTFDTKYGAKMTGYVKPTTYENDDWLITSAMDLSSYSTKATLNFSNAWNYNGNAVKLMISTDYDGTSAPSTATWTDITSSVSNWATGSAWTFVESGDVDLTSYCGNSAVYIAFQYTCDTTAAGTWEFNNVSVIAK